MFAWLFSIAALCGCAHGVSGEARRLEIPAALPAAAPSLLEEIRRRGVLKVGTTGDFVPFSYRPAAAVEYHGVDIELAKDLAAALDVRVEFVPTTWPTLMDDLAASKFDIGMSGISLSSSRQRRAWFSDPVLSTGKAAITRDAEVDRFRSLEDINKPGVRVIVNRGGTNEAFARENFPRATLILSDDNRIVFQRIVCGDADVMVTDAMETLVQQTLHPQLEAVNPHEPFDSFEMGFLLQRDPALKTFVDEWLELRKEDGTYRRVYDRELRRVADGVSQSDVADGGCSWR